MFNLFKTVMLFDDRELIKKCGLDAYFFLRYLKTLLVIFIPICLVVLPVLIPVNYVGGRGKNINPGKNDASRKDVSQVIGLDTLAWGNVAATKTDRYGAHLLMAILVVIWVCTVVFFELRVYIKVRQDYLMSAEHRLRASATTVLVNSIPDKWLSEEALDGLFDVFPGGVRNIWINRDLSGLLDKITLRGKIHRKLESAGTDLVKSAKKAQLKKKEIDEKKRRKSMKLKALTKKEKAEQSALEDREAKRMANDEGGATAGDQHEVPHSVDAGVRASRIDSPRSERSSKAMHFPLIGAQVSKVAGGIKNIVGKAENMVDKADDRVDDTLETTNGFVGLDKPGATGPAPIRTVGDRRAEIAAATDDIAPPSATETTDRPISGLSAESQKAIHRTMTGGLHGNKVRKLEKEEDLYNQQDVKIWQFWKPPAGAYTSPVPQGEIAQEYMAKHSDTHRSVWAMIKPFLPFMGGQDMANYEYPIAYNPDYKEEEQPPAEWEKYLKQKDRPTHRLAPFGVMWLPGLPLFNKKVDTINWCREELARLNLEIEEDQNHPERFPLSTSAFIQFNHQVAAHMACQSAVHHIPKQMAPRVVEISPRDVDWSNMAVTWWQEWTKTLIVWVIIAAMLFLWAIPVAWTAALGQLDQLIRNNEWLHFLEENDTVRNLAKVIAGVLPAVFLALLLFVVPVILNMLGAYKGLKTGAQRTEFVQTFYFVFLFVQVFLIVSIASFFAASIDKLVKNLSDLRSVSDVLDLLAKNLPKAANYFFSYMILQAMSVSSGTLLQIGTLFVWYILARIMDSTARNKWTRNTKLNTVTWGKFFPIYTNFACIGLVYSVIAPLISLFAIITFSLLYFAHRYTMLYVTRFESDTGGVLYPRAINQTFTGIYVMELCLAGLFFIVIDENDNHTCTTHGIVMFVVLGCTIVYQVLLNQSFSPLFRYLPISFEDEAVLRDEAFQRAQDRRFGVIEEEAGEDIEDQDEKLVGNDQDIEMQKLGEDNQGPASKNPMRQVGTWAKDGGAQLGHLAKGGGKQLRRLDPRGGSEATQYRHNQRQKDLEAQRAIGEALYGGFHDEIEDLTPDERDALVRHAFQHSALRARRPVVWLPRDDLGVSDDEVRRMKAYSDNIWISNEGTALDSKVRVVYGKSPPDFSEVDVINL